VGPDGDGFPYCTTWVREPAQCDRDGGATKALLRDRGLFVGGDAPARTLDDSKAAQGKIRQVIVLIQENHSMDNMFGFTRIPDVNSLRAPTLPLPTWTPAPFRLTTTCPAGPAHQWADMHTQWSEGTLAGMADVDVGAMGVYLDDDHPFYTSLGAQFGLADRYFGSALGGTWANRNYLYLGTSQGIKDTGQLPFPSARSIFDELDAAHVNWAYSAKRPLHTTGAGATRIAEGTLGFRFAPGGPDFGRIVPYEKFLAEVDAFDPVKSNPMVWFVDGGKGFDEHPGKRSLDAVHAGERLVAELILDHVMKSPGWQSTAVFVSYDESGGYVDHVAPPSAAPPDATQPEFNYLGFRVPLFVVSPWAIRGVSHLVHSHTSILRFLEALFDLPALTARDANSDALLDMFDFTGERAVGTAIPLLARPWAGASCGVSASSP
jgi:phospholipase C